MILDGDFFIKIEVIRLYVEPHERVIDFPHKWSTTEDIANGVGCEPMGVYGQYRLSSLECDDIDCLCSVVSTLSLPCSMASQKKRRKDYLESNGVPVIFVSSVKGQAKAVTVLDDSTQCYTWSKSGRIDRRKDKTEIQTFVCTTCRALNAKANQGLVTKTNFDLPTKKLIKFEDGHAEWQAVWTGGSRTQLEIESVVAIHKLDRSFFSLFDLPAEAPKTTNVAESYHANLVHHFRSKKVTLGTWITDFRDLHNMEVLICEDVIRGKEIPVHLKEEYRRNAAEIEEAKRQLQDDDLEGIFDASHNSSMESVNTAKLGQYLVVVGAHMGNSENNKRRIAETGTEDPEIVEEENDEEEYDENDEPLDENYRGMESSIELEESESDDDDSQ
ncbi:hypothetical protein DdX_10477 [Ditylenchus destructor]|uniref:Uncharacterized protein n=1 Tax=Ditylenchus destructor TaxID=166010 RepID=A0AAD4MXW2_9BILA|nr:hypothetical protein DdX_10477 [Ditylenchus destructor]